ncbi:hypothetical protein [Plasmodium yoelii yoelii]|uniref:Uncharacterized protein n=1 Tax=Plasmodium yoelii yoelii TaxID=73239 RepID=Q7RAE9_PLAYO|nr:hypothetical protein [Plasmodium yoelii yoelii]
MKYVIYIIYIVVFSYVEQCNGFGIVSFLGADSAARVSLFTYMEMIKRNKTI